MSKRDPVKTQRNKEINELTNKIKALLPDVLKVSGYDGELSLNATFGGKMQEYANVKFNSFQDSSAFKNAYLTGFMKTVENLPDKEKRQNPYCRALKVLKDNPIVQKWLELFLERTFKKNYDEYTGLKPHNEEEGLIWIGQENASYGIGITPRFNGIQWENDKSEIRSFNKEYFTIGHILKTGFLIPSKDKRIVFHTVDEYLTFFKEVIVRLSRSPHETEIAERYCSFVNGQVNRESIPLLIPEYRYNGIESKHLYRLDFCVLNYRNGSKVGFELSPWSTHGRIKHVNEKTQQQVNNEAQNNFHEEIQKYNNYFIKYGITVLAYTDQDFKNYNAIFDDIKKYLTANSGECSLSQAFETLKCLNL